MTKLSRDIEPLEPELWFTALEQVWQQSADAASVESLLRHAFHLLQLAPRPLRDIVRCELDEDSFERLLDRGAFDSAAVALVGAPAGFALLCSALLCSALLCSALLCSAGNRGRVFQATVRLPGQSRQPIDARSESAVCALVGAWTTCLLALTQRSFAAPAPRPALHRRPVELHPKSIEP